MQFSKALCKILLTYVLSHTERNKSVQTLKKHGTHQSVTTPYFRSSNHIYACWRNYFVGHMEIYGEEIVIILCFNFKYTERDLMKCGYDIVYVSVFLVCLLHIYIYIYTHTKFK
jgi:hypothetical protein